MGSGDVEPPRYGVEHKTFPGFPEGFPGFPKRIFWFSRRISWVFRRVPQVSTIFPPYEVCIMVILHCYQVILDYLWTVDQKQVNTSFILFLCGSILSGPPSRASPCHGFGCVGFCWTHVVKKQTFTNDPSVSYGAPRRTSFSDSLSSGIQGYLMLGVG